MDRTTSTDSNDSREEEVASSVSSQLLHDDCVETNENYYSSGLQSSLEPELIGLFIY